MAEDTDNQMILAVPRRELILLKQKDLFQGFMSSKDVSFIAAISHNYNWFRRGDIENDSNFQQIIPYAVIRNHLNRFYGFKRSKKREDYSEGRLRENWSFGVGGHIEEGKDSKPDESIIPFTTQDLLEKAMERELGEEVDFCDSFERPTIHHVGYINDEENDVGKVHFGLIYLVQTNANVVVPKKQESENGKIQEASEGRLMSLSELEEKIKLEEKTKDKPEKVIVENWSKILFDNYIKPHFG